MTSTEKQFKDKDGNDITDANAVHKTGAETIDGQKTFTSSLVASNAGFSSTRSKNTGSFIKRVSDIDITTPPTSLENIRLNIVYDQNSVQIGTIGFQYTTDGKTKLVTALRNADGTTKVVILAESD